MMEWMDVVQWFIGMVFVIAIIGFIVFATISSMNDEKFCESKGGESNGNDCLIKEDGIYKIYNVRTLNNGMRVLV